MVQGLHISRRKKCVRLVWLFGLEGGGLAVSTIA